MGLFTAAPDGSDPVPLLDDPAIWALAPIWSPDGTLVAFSGADTTSDSEAVVIGVVGADGSGLRWTIPGGSGGYPVAMAWSPDGTRLAYASETEPTATLWVVAADGTGVIALAEVPGTIEALAWSPDGAQIALHVDDFGDVGGDGRSHVNLRQTGVSQRSPTATLRSRAREVCSNRRYIR
jgi:sugar lactone lactonase YvrE